MLLRVLRKVSFTSESKALAEAFANLDLEIKASPRSPEVPVDQVDLGFGSLFTPHMLEIDYSDAKGWEHAVIRPFENFSIHPANSTLHYALTCYEGIPFHYIVIYLHFCMSIYMNHIDIILFRFWKINSLCSKKLALTF